MNAVFTWLLQNYMPVIISALAGIIIRYIPMWFKKMTAWLDARLGLEQHATTLALLSQVTQIVETVVLNLIQTNVDNYKKNGTWNAAVASDTLKQALAQIETELKTRGLWEQAVKAMPDIISWLTKLIEAIISKQKTAGAAPTISPTIILPASTDVPNPLNNVKQ